MSTDPPVTAAPRGVVLPPWLRFETVGLPAALLALCVFLGFTAPNFATINNLFNILQSASFIGIIAFGMTLVIIAGDIDISVGSAVALGSALLGVLSVTLGLPMWLAVILVLAEATVFGAFAGFIRARFRVPSFIVTLALFSALRGLALLATNGFPVGIPDPGFQFLGAGRIGIVPFPAIILVITFLIFWFVSKRTSFGRTVYAIGGNAEAARLSGLPVFRTRIVIFAITGLLAGFVGILQASRLASGNPTIATGLEFDVIAAVIIGGTSLSGGRGSMWGTFLGVLLITILRNGMVLLGVNPYAQQVFSGVVVLAAVLVSYIRTQRGRET
jgi:simple sugar transport system permease protein